jgi:hypothetical protein
LPHAAPSGMESPIGPCGLEQRRLSGLRKQRECSIHWWFGNRDWRTQRPQLCNTSSHPGRVAICVSIFGGDGSLRRIFAICQRGYFRTGGLAIESQLRHDRLRRLGNDGFFVISVFCVHRPLRNGKALPVARFYARRWVRILNPEIAAITLYRFSMNRESLSLVRSPLRGVASNIRYLAVHLRAATAMRYTRAIFRSASGSATAQAFLEARPDVG